MFSLSLKLAYKYLKSNKGGVFSFTSFLAIIGLVIGVSSLIIVSSVMNGFEKELENRILGVIPHSVIQSDNDLIINYQDVIDQINDLNPSISAVPYISFQSLVSSEYSNEGVLVTGIDYENEENISILPNLMIAGELNNLSDINNIIIGSLLAAKLGVYTGETINLTTSNIRSSIIGSYPKSITLNVVGIFESKTEIDSSLVLISHKSAQLIKSLKSKDTIGIRLKTNNLFKAEEISREIVQDLDDEFYFYSWKKTHGTLFEAIKFEKLLISLMLFLIVTVATILVFSTIIMTVKTKEREIGILMTLGISNYQLSLIFFLQGIILSVIGILIGTVLGLIITVNLENLIFFMENIFNRKFLDAYFINYFPYYIDTPQIIFICLISLILSSVFSFLPSLRIAKLNPVEILRHE